MPRSVKQRHPKRYLVRVSYEKKQRESDDGYVMAHSRAEAKQKALKITKKLNGGAAHTSKHKVVWVREDKDVTGIHPPPLDENEEEF
jgi:hypothetical protein